MIETRADLVKLLKDFKAEGCPYSTLVKQGVTVPSAAAAELTRAGYELEVIDTGGGARKRDCVSSTNRGSETSAASTGGRRSSTCLPRPGRGGRMTVTERPTHAYCPACKEESAIDNRGRCLWCDGPTREKKKRGGWKRPDLRARSKLTDPMLRLLYKLHIEEGRSINSLAKEVYARVGYGSHHAAASRISKGWKRLGLEARDRIEQVQLTCTIHGLAPKHGSRPGYGTYKRRLHRPDRPLCAALKKQPPRKGEPCQRPAMEDSHFCASHDPARAAVRDQHLAAMRAKQPTREKVPMGPFIEFLRRRREELGSYGAVAEATGLHRSQVYRWKDGQDSRGRVKDTITVEVVDRALYSDGTTTFEELYEMEAAAA